jgi:CheY-specific phosphatase CheX
VAGCCSIAAVLSFSQKLCEGSSILPAEKGYENPVHVGEREMDAEMRKVLYQTLAEVFEKMFYTVLEQTAEAGPEAVSALDHFEATISFRGDREGSVRFYVPDSLARHITHNLLGIQQECLTENQLCDTVKETANMAVGSLLGKLDPQGTCRLSIPTCSRGNFPTATVVDHPGACSFNTEAGVLWLLFAESPGEWIP